MRWFFRLFTKSQWARKRLGGKWERIVGGQWEEVPDWSTPTSRPDVYGAGSIPDREEWDD